MLLYNTDSWHYVLVLYVFTKEFFMETDGLDFKAMDSQYNPQTKTDDFKIIYKMKSRTVNFCPYCRAVLGASLMLPFVYLWRLYPHKPKPKKTHAEIMKNIHRRGWIARIGAASINAGFGINHLINGLDDGTFVIAIIQFALAASLLTGHLWAPQIIRWLILHSPKWERKPKPDKPTKSKEPSKIVQKIKSTHDIYCPPIFFVEPINLNKLK